MRLLKSIPDVQLVILALELKPGMSGEEWLAWFQENQPSETRLVVASGKGDILTCTKGNNGISALTKPFHMEELEELIDCVLAPDWLEKISADSELH